MDINKYTFLYRDINLSDKLPDPADLSLLEFTVIELLIGTKLRMAQY